MSSSVPRKKRPAQIAAALFGVALLAYLVLRSGSDQLLEKVRTIGWIGFLLVVGLAGVSHVLKTWGWRLTAPGQFSRVPFSRTFGLRLVSEAIGQFGFIGQVVGDATRASLLSSDLPASSLVSSVALDRGLFMVTGLVVAIAGFISLAFVSFIPRGLRIVASISAAVMLVLFGLSVIAVRRGWPLLSGGARLASRLPWLRGWLQSKEEVISSAEKQLLNFHHQSPSAFWTSTGLNFAAHGLAIGEVYLILVLMGSKISLFGALTLEALTKLINAVGGFNPGNVGTYEGGNMAIVKLVGLTAGVGLTLGLCRRLRGLAWAAVGGVCLLYFSRSSRSSQPGKRMDNRTESKDMLAEAVVPKCEESRSLQHVAIIIANQRSSTGVGSNYSTAKVGALPLGLRAILSAQAAGANRIVMVVDHVDGLFVREALLRTGRLPASVEWVSVPSEEWLQVEPNAGAISMVLRGVADDAQSVMVIAADASYRPSVYRRVAEWNVAGGALKLACDGRSVGMIALSRELALDLASDTDSQIDSIGQLHAWLRGRHVNKFGPTVVYCDTVPEGDWQQVANEDDRLTAEKKLEAWLTKPTDGIFARMNRKVSIPISRQLIKFPITPNMVSFFTLGVSIASAVYFALGGYWNVLIGASLSVWGSILDGCDGEVARMKLQASDFGCWLDSICDYLWYILVFIAMPVGLARSSGSTSYYTWGAMLLFGAVATMVLASLGRKRLSGRRPEQYLAVWQKEAESRKSNPLAYVGRNCEFIVRRCFLPYALLAFALSNLLWIPICVGAVGANLAWIISGYSLFAFSPKKSLMVMTSGRSAHAAGV